MCESVGDPHFSTWEKSAYSFQGLGVFELARVPDAPLRVHALHCRYGEFGSSNAALAFELGGIVFELYGTDLYIAGALQPRAYAQTTLDGGVVVVRARNFFEFKLGRVRIAVVVQFGLGGGDGGASAAAGYWLNVRLFAPIANVSSAELTGLCASPDGEAAARDRETALFNTSAPRFDALIALCGIEEPEPPGGCAEPGVGSCCPARPSIGESEALCAFAACDELAFARCVYDCW